MQLLRHNPTDAVDGQEAMRHQQRTQGVQKGVGLYERWQCTLCEKVDNDDIEHEALPDSAEHESQCIVDANCHPTTKLESEMVDGCADNGLVTLDYSAPSVNIFVAYRSQYGATAKAEHEHARPWRRTRPRAADGVEYGLRVCCR
jgi:hypothetical protein